MMQKVILASASPQRKILMSCLDIPFEIIPADIDEKEIRDKDFAARAKNIARAKALAVAEKHQGIIIAADTFPVHESGRILEKPESLQEAREMLFLQSGTKQTVYTGFCYLDRENGIEVNETFTNEVSFRELYPEEIESYVQNLPVLSWSAAYAPAYAYGMSMLKSNSGSLTAFTHGLPMETLIPLLKKSGFLIRPNIEFSQKA
jgi:septum formation protein